MRVHARKWGNSASVSLPAAILAAASVSIDQAVDVREEAGRIIIEPERRPAYDLDTMLDRVDPKTFPEDVDFGPPQGDEAW